jgi:hypothetical protein
MRHRFALFQTSAEQAGDILRPLRKRIERSDPCVFRMEYIGGLVVDSLSTSKPFEELFCLLFLRRKKVREKSGMFVISNNYTTILLFE